MTRVRYCLWGILVVVMVAWSAPAHAQTAPSIPITITKTATFGTDRVTFTVTVTNTSAAALDIYSRDKVPQVYRILSSPESIQETCSRTCGAEVAGQLITVFFPQVAAGETATWRFEATFIPGTAQRNIAVAQGIENGKPTSEVSAFVDPRQMPQDLPNTGGGAPAPIETGWGWGMEAACGVLIVGVGLGLRVRAIRARRPVPVPAPTQHGGR